VTNGDAKRRFRLVLAVSAGLLLLLAMPAILGRVYCFGDLGALQLPYRLLFAQSLQRGESLSWSPWVHCGWDLQGVANYYHPILYLLYRCLPVMAAYAVELLAAYPVMFAGMYWLLRRWDFPQDAAALGGMALAFSGYSLSHFNHTSMILALAHIPWLLAAIDVLLREPVRSKAAWAWLAISLLTASELLTSFPQAVWFSTICESGYSLLLILRHGGWRRVPALITAKLLGILTGSLQLLLTIQALAMSTRAAPTVDFVSSFSMHPAIPLQFIDPSFFKSFFDRPCSDESMLFDGVFTTVLCAWAAYRWRHLVKRRKIVALAGGVALLGLLLALGDNWPKIYLLQRYLPLVGKFRCPCRYIFFVHCGMAVIAAVALEDLAKSAADRSRQAAYWLWLIAGASLIAAFVGVVLKLSNISGVSEYLAVPWQMFVGVGLITVAVGVTAAAANGSRPALLAIIGGAALERAIYVIPTVVVACSTSFADFTAGVLVPPAPTTHRVLVEEKDCWDRPALSVRGLRNASGYAVLQPARALDAHVDAAARVLEVEWVYADGHWRHVPDPVPYVRLVARCVRSHPEGTRPGVDLKNIDVLDTALVQADIQLPPGPAGTAELVSDVPGRLLIKTNSGLERVLAVAESFHPCWQVRIDGTAAAPLPLYGDLLGCVVPAGQHQVEFVYHSAALELGTWLSLSGLAISLAVFTVWWFAGGMPSRRGTRYSGSASRHVGNSPEQRHASQTCPGTRCSGSAAGRDLSAAQVSRGGVKACHPAGDVLP
jgi:hypothetical protein